MIIMQLPRYIQEIVEQDLIPYLYQVYLEGPENIFDGRAWVMPAAEFLAGLP